MAVTMKSAVFWVAMRCFSPACDGFLIVFLFDLKDGGDTFLRNVELSPNCTVLQFLAKTAGIPAEIQCGYFPKIDKKHYRLSQISR
jgi:pyruvate-formate lyase-activating enzyme